MAESSATPLTSCTPEDGVTSVAFSRKSSNLLACTSWDSTLRVFDSASDKLIQCFNLGHPVMDCCWNADDSKIYVGCLDGSVSSCDLRDGSHQQIGSHKNAAKCVRLFSNGSCNLLFSGGWDGQIVAWDLSSNSMISQKNVDDSAPIKVLTMDCSLTSLVVGLSDRRILIFDLRTLVSAEPNIISTIFTNPQIRESSLAHQTRCVCCFPDQLSPADQRYESAGFATSSIEARVAIDFLSPTEASQARKFAFKAHRQQNASTGKTVLYPINALAFHPVHGTFATGGCDGVVSLWDKVAKKRLG